MAHTHNIAYSSNGFADSIHALFAGFKAARVQRAKYRQTLSELGGMTDRDLMDIGISRYDIEAIALEHAYGK